ncbi:MAG: aminotransferase class IV [Firmicutes bacterium]|nr:aminotransferase class IV [Bacillota bacterium]
MSEAFRGSIYMNDRLVPASEAVVSVLEPGFLYGESVFETLRTYDGRCFRLDAHLRRLEAGVRAVNLRLPVTLERLSSAVLETVRANLPREGGECRVRITVSATRPPGGPDVIVQARPLREGGEQPDPRGLPGQRSGYSAHVVRIRRDERSPLAALKTGNYLVNLLAMAEAKAVYADEAILMNLAGKVSEGSRTNVFVLVGDTVVTPSERSGILPGITRECVMRLAEGLGICCRAEELSVEELMGAGEVFVTNSVVGVMPVTRLSAHWGESGCVGPAAGSVTRRLGEAYLDLARRGP